MPRVPDDVLQELIDNDGCRRGSASPINSTGIVRLALDLQEARRQIAYLESCSAQTSSLLSAVARHTQSVIRASDQDRASKSTRLDRGKRTKKK